MVRQLHLYKTLKPPRLQITSCSVRRHVVSGQSETNISECDRVPELQSSNANRNGTHNDGSAFPSHDNMKQKPPPI
jgi:hypothetical protein